LPLLPRSGALHPEHPARIDAAHRLSCPSWRSPPPAVCRTSSAQRPSQVAAPLEPSRPRK
jgi:hypothetical protein